jgi:predicted  nucleic acid-binding Zn-ribbon protein
MRKNRPMMETVTQYADVKVQLQERVKALEAECVSLQNDVAVEREKLAVIELEKQIAALENKATALKSEKSLIQDKIRGTAQNQKKGTIPP